MDDTDDTNLAARWRAGDRRAGRLLFDGHREAVEEQLRAHGLLGRTAQVFARAQRSLDELERHGSFAALLAARVRELVAEQRRRGRGGETGPLADTAVLDQCANPLHPCGPSSD